MKKIFLVIGCIFAFTTSAIAEVNNPKINVVKKAYLYEFERESGKWSNDNYYDGIEKYGNTALKNAYKIDHECNQKNEMPCELDASIMFSGSQDGAGDVKFNKISYLILPNGLVRASFKMYGKIAYVDYLVECKENDCKIADVVNGKWSLKNTLSHASAS